MVTSETMSGETFGGIPDRDPLTLLS